MKPFKPYIVLTVLILLAACASNPFFSSWKAPDATPLQLTGSKVAAVVMMDAEGSRRAGEDALARELSAIGAIGIPLYLLLPDISPDNEEEVRKGLEEAGIAGMVVMRPVGNLAKVESTGIPYGGPRYAGLWGGYYGYGWGAAWDRGDIRTSTVVYVETLVYSLKQNKLVWGGQSKTTNPSTIDRLINDTSKKVASELTRLGLM